MEPVTVAIIGLAALIVLLLMGVPVATTMFIISIAGTATLVSFDASLVKLATSTFESINSYNFAVMPLFILMANIISNTGVGQSLYDFFNKCIGRFRGGLAMATIASCAIFAAINSSNLATVLTIGVIAYPEMKRLNYSSRLSTGSIAAGGTLGALIPPSGIMITYGIISQTSISKLFMAGIIPGISLALLMCISIIITCRMNPAAGPKGPVFPAKEALKAFLGCGEIVLLIVLVLGGMFYGWFTPTEAGAMGATGAIIITLLRKKLTMSSFLKAIQGTLKNVGTIFFIIVAALFMNYFMAVSTFPVFLANIITGLNADFRLVVLVIVLIYLVAGTFLDAMGMILLTIPIFVPIMHALGVDLVWFGIIIIICMEMSCITPPIGLNVFIAASLDKSVAMEETFKGIFPFLIAMLVMAGLLILFPQIALYLPSLM